MNFVQRYLFYLSITFSILLIKCTTMPQHADLVLFNGKIITVDQDFSIAQALAIKDGKLLAVGPDKEILKAFSNSTKRIDLKGRTVIPGIIEGHAHPIPASQSELFYKIPDLHSIDELLTWIYNEAHSMQNGEWVIHPKFFATRMREMRQPTLVELDSVAPDIPVFLNGSYAGMINTAAMTYSDIIKSFDREDIIKDKDTGKPNGLLLRSAFSLLKIDKDDLSENVKLNALADMLRLYNQVGITSVCSGIGTTENLDLYRALKENGNLTVRVFQNIRIPFPPSASKDQMRSALKELGYKTGDGDEWVRVGALKATIDGGVLTGTAFLREPWGLKGKEIYGITDPDYRGELFVSKKELANIISLATELEWKFTSHVTGGGGVDTLLAAYQEVNKTTPIIDKRFSIIHGNFFTAESIQKMSDLGVYADMQPAWFYKDSDLLKKVLGDERIKTFHPYRSLFEAGIIVNGGSDHMVKLDSYTSINPYNPFLSMWSVVARKTENGSIIVAEEAISREQALRMFTINNAYASFEENLKGSIEPGKFADLAVLSQDILTCPEDAIKDIKVLMTMVDGKIVYDNNIGN